MYVLLFLYRNKKRRNSPKRMCPLFLIYPNLIPLFIIFLVVERKKNESDHEQENSDGEEDKKKRDRFKSERPRETKPNKPEPGMTQLRNVSVGACV